MNDDAWTTPAPAVWAPAPFPGATMTQQEAAILAQSQAQSEANMGMGGVVPVGRRLKFGEALEVGMNLARSSWNVVTRAPSLLGVTAVSLVVGVLLLVGYATLLGGVANIDTGGRFVVAVKDFPLFAMLGVVGSIAQGVIVVVTRDMLDGRPPSMSKGWGAAMARLPQLVAFGLIFAAERSLTNMLRNTRGGKIAARAIDYAWDFATYLAVPVIMFEPRVSGYGSVKRSAELVRTRMGAQLAATGTISLAVFICTLPVLIVAVLVGAAISTSAAIALAVLVLLTELVVSATLQGVCSAVMYRFVTTGIVGAQFSERQLMRVFGVRPAGPAMAY
jgi:hypothetical protein